MIPSCLSDSPSIRTGGIGGLPDIPLKPTVDSLNRVCVVLLLLVRGQKQGFALPRVNTWGSKGFPLGQVCKAERLAP